MQFSPRIQSTVQISVTFGVKELCVLLFSSSLFEGLWSKVTLPTTPGSSARVKDCAHTQVDQEMNTLANAAPMSQVQGEWPQAARLRWH